WLGQVLGRSHDAEMLAQRMRDRVAAQPDELATGPVGRRVDLELEDRRRGAHADQVAALEGDRYFRLLDALDDLVADPPLTARAVADGRTPRARDQGLREVAKRAKRARYAAESAVPVAGKPARRLADR